MTKSTGTSGSIIRASPPSAGTAERIACNVDNQWNTCEILCYDACWFKRNLLRFWGTCIPVRQIRNIFFCDLVSVVISQ